MNKAQMEIAQTVADVIAAQIEPLRLEIAELRAQLIPQGIKTIADIMRDYSYTRKVIVGNPWLMPNFGRSDFPGRIRKWKAETYRKWYEVPMAMRQHEWGGIPLAEKNRLRGIK